ncbi:MAG: hypothetical protein B6D41_00120 [Chloroflexi bacterium UTCFX4]|jgi:hypothetical protein|nr:MAG: hypothetical protein B6D41_00120 [Chloroflexi bacterium UTCFX4]
MLLDTKPLTPAIGEAVLPSAHLLELCRAYLAMVDEPDGHTSTPERDAERAAAHDALIEQMRAEDFIGTPNRVQARWLARYFVQTDFLQAQRIAPREGRTLLFWRVNSEPLYPKLEAFPPFDEHEERAALAFYKPVWVRINAFFKEAKRTEVVR